MKQIIIQPGLSEEFSLAIEIRIDEECVGATYVTSFPELIEKICSLELSKELPWRNS